jgi:hypothetical protein
MHLIKPKIIFNMIFLKLISLHKYIDPQRLVNPEQLTYYLVVAVIVEGACLGDEF